MIGLNMAVDKVLFQFFGPKAALAQSFHEDHLALISAVVVLLLGICFIPPLGGANWDVVVSKLQ